MLNSIIYGNSLDPTNPDNDICNSIYSNRLIAGFPLHFSFVPDGYGLGGNNIHPSDEDPPLTPGFDPQTDYELLSSSPCKGAGKDGADMGVYGGAGAADGVGVQGDIGAPDDVGSDLPLP
jgi:hypothetical protein